MQLTLKYQDDPFSISHLQDELWKVMHLRLLERVYPLPLDETNLLPEKRRLTFSCTGKVGPFLKFQGATDGDPISLNDFGLTIGNPFLSYKICITSSIPLADFTLYHGSSELQLCMSDKFTPIKYCGEIQSLTFTVTEYHHLYFVTTSPIVAGSVSCVIRIKKGATKTYTEKRGCLRTKDQVKEVYRLTRDGNDFVVTCPADVEAMYQSYLHALKSEQLPFPLHALKAKPFFTSIPIGIHFELQEGYPDSYCFICVTEGRVPRNYISIKQGTKLKFGWSVVKFGDASINPRDWVLCAYNAHSSCIGTWSCSRTNVDIVFSTIEYLILKIENQNKSINPGTIELVNYELQLLPAS